MYEYFTDMSPMMMLENLDSVFEVDVANAIEYS